MVRTSSPLTNAPRAANSRPARLRVCLSCMIGVTMLVGLSGGCSRPFWRTQADFDAYNLLFEKTADERWDVPRLTLESDPRSRIFDPYDPDRTPLPPDDPFANQYMHWVDGMQGYKSWHRFGQQMSVENPQWLAQFEFLPQTFREEWLQPASEDEPPLAAVPTIRNLTLEQAIELANINSRDYQLQLENVYLSALALTFARFQFNVRYLGLNGLQPTSNLNYVNQPSTLDTFSFANRFGVSQLLPTGGQWIVEMANNTLWLFSTPGQTNSASVLSYSIVQPLLTGAGRKIVLENLTLNERQVLYAVRNLARFRQTFFGDVVDGTTGYLNLLSQYQQVENLRFNLRELRIQIEKLQAAYSQKPTRVSERLKALPEGLDIPPDLAQRLHFDEERGVITWTGDLTEETESRLLSLSADRDYQRAVRYMGAAYRTNVMTQDLSQLITREPQTVTSLRSAEGNYLFALDNYKLLLGIPTDFQVTVDRSLLKPFELIDPALNRLEDRLQQVVKTWGDVDGTNPPQERLREMTAQLRLLWRTIQQEGLTLIERDFEREARNRPTRLARLPTDAARQLVRDNVSRDRLLFQRNQDDHEELGTVLSDLERLLEAPDLPLDDVKEFPPDLQIGALKNFLDQEELPGRVRVLGALRNIRDNMVQMIQGLKVIQVGTRTELITLQPFNMSLDDVIATALENRLDLMNARAQVMDARRAMEVAANRMEGVLNIVTRGDIRNSGGHDPFDFRADKSTFQAGVQFTAPLDQVQVRNTYRASLITYQQARRAYMLLEDQIKQQVRQEWRQLKQLEANFETNRQNLRYSAINLDVTIESTFLPTQSSVSNLPQPGAGVRPPAQNVGLNILNALNNILAAQNSLIQTWVQYETNRINIYQDMGMMEIDERGIWVDPVYQPASVIQPSLPSEPADVLPPELPLRDDRAADDASPDGGAVSETGVSSLSATSVEPGRTVRVGNSGVFRLARRTERPAVADQ